MRRLILAIALGALCATVLAQAAPKVTKYNRATEMTIRGDVQQIRDYPCPVSRGVGRHLTLRTADGSLIEVHLGPVEFVEVYGINLTLSPVEIVGSAVEINGTPTVLARLVTQKNTVYQFRDERGDPLW